MKRTDRQREEQGKHPVVGKRSASSRKRRQAIMAGAQ